MSIANENRVLNQTSTRLSRNEWRRKKKLKQNLKKQEKHLRKLKKNMLAGFKIRRIFFGAVERS